ncbi:thiol peroxidase [Streptococcus rifensis]
MPTFIGKPVTVDTAKQLQVGDIAPEFSLMATDLSTKSLSDFDGKKKVISIVPSVDTGICSTQTRKFNEALSELEDTVVITVSADLPFAQDKWCAAEGLDNAILLSDYYDNRFGKAYGVLMEEWHLLARAVLVLDKDNKVTYVEYLDNVNSEPDYEPAIEAVKAIN